MNMLPEEKQLLEERKKLREKAILNEMSRLKSKNTKLYRRSKIFMAISVLLVIVAGVVIYSFRMYLETSEQYKIPVNKQNKQVLEHQFAEVYFRIQIGAYLTRNNELLSGDSELVSVDEFIDDRYRYFIGKHKTLQQATLQAEALKEHGFQDAFIVPFKDKKPTDWKVVWSEL
ncbi:hypothetical protein K4L44_16035 [Halosquirtibacter laminarini]|uniref:Uncharacterized protein n=1 Tax=Halosquirtibacter laminarini TaxID=3374600 RepID=A0AC61NER8_9BACT|nr:hypothetical protein K4L44_16035 [Prolixibacteraceae bacterium]